jgi:hypothetical protein
MSLYDDKVAKDDALDLLGRTSGGRMFERSKDQLSEQFKLAESEFDKANSLFNPEERKNAPELWDEFIPVKFDHRMQSWTVQYYEGGRPKMKTYSARKWGNQAAREKAMLIYYKQNYQEAPELVNAGLFAQA